MIIGQGIFLGQKADDTQLKGLIQRDLTSLEIPQGTTSIADYIFYNYSSLTSVIIPNSVTSIGYEAFRGCTSLAEINIPDSVTSIGSGAFRGCTSLASVTIPNSVTNIGGSAFYHCTSLASITIPNSVTSIGVNAFINCTELDDIDLTDFDETSTSFVVPSMDGSSFSGINPNAKFYFKNQSTLNAFANARGWEQYSSKFEVRQG